MNQHMATICDCGRPTAGARLCDRCEKTFGYAIANIAAYSVDLGVVERGQARYGGSVTSAPTIGKAQPLPVDMRFVDAGPPPDDDTSGRPRPATIAPGNQLQWDMHNTIDAWCRTLLEDQPPVHGPTCPDRIGCLHVSCAGIRRRRHPADTIPAMCYYLARQFRWILTQAWVPEMMGELLDLERRLARFVDRPPDRWYAGRCGIVCTSELYVEVGRAVVTCSACDTRHDVAARRDFLLAQAKDYLVTATEAAGALMSWTDYDGSQRNLVARIGMWKGRKQVQVRGQVEIGGQDRDLYRLGDLQDLLIGDAQREQGRALRGTAGNR